MTSLDTALHHQYRIKSSLALRNKIYCKLVSQGLTHRPMAQIVDAKNHLKKFCKLLEEAARDVIDKPNTSFINWVDLLAEKTAHNTQSRSHSAQTHSRTTPTPHSISNASIIESLLLCMVNDISKVMDKGFCHTNKLFSVEKKLKDLKESKKPKITLKCKGCSTASPGTREGRKINKQRKEKIAKGKSLGNDYGTFCPHVPLLFYPRATCPKNLTRNLTLTRDPPLAKPKKPSRYTEAYRLMDFLPYSALSPTMEELVFSNKTPSIDYNDPYWPSKSQCLEVVEGLSDNLPRFTGTFLTPEAHGIK